MPGGRKRQNDGKWATRLPALCPKCDAQMFYEQCPECRKRIMPEPFPADEWKPIFLDAGELGRKSTNGR
jgi:hypothetical protein